MIKKIFVFSHIYSVICYKKYCTSKNNINLKIKLRLKIAISQIGIPDIALGEASPYWSEGN